MENTTFSLRTELRNYAEKTYKSCTLSFSPSMDILYQDEFYPFSICDRPFFTLSIFIIYWKIIVNDFQVNSKIELYKRHKDSDNK